MPTNPNGRCTLFTSLKIRNENSWQHFYHLQLFDYQLIEIQCHTCCLVLLICPLNGFPHPSCYVPNGKPAQPNGVQPLTTVSSVGKIIDHLKARLTLSVPQQEKKTYIHETKMVASMGEMDVTVLQVAIYRNNLTAYLLLATELTEK